MKYFTADLHIDFERAMGFPQRRQFTLTEWQKICLDMLNTKVRKEDILYILGDFAEYPEKWRHLIKCKNIYLIVGNHEPSLGKCEKVFGKDQVRLAHEIKMGDTTCFLSHYPHLIWPQSHNGSLHLYGHLHDQRTDYWDKVPQLWGMRSLDVCPESYKRHYGEFGVFSETEILDILLSKPGHDNVEYYKKNFGELLNET
jgi:calcineurin-like phosphoesterase family protein